jgi:Holliday junction resolvase-like predicted endonuclease
MNDLKETKVEFNKEYINGIVDNEKVSWDEMGLIIYIASKFTTHKDNYLRNNGNYLTKNNLMDTIHTIKEYGNNSLSKSYLKKKILSLEKKNIILSESHPVDKRNKIFYLNPCLFNDDPLLNNHSNIDKNENIKPDKFYKKSEFLEKDLENILIKDLNVIEEGLVLIDNQYEVRNGYIDILARDRNNILCIIELKISRNDTKIIEQCVYYPTQFNEYTRMITIAPAYGKKITQSLKSLGYVEMKIYNLNGDKLSISNNKS